ncbi:MAG: hypothetical protein JWN34_4300 [Bryobacterales bacterium]|nr:hypothetical protein [Bryobacterales bacterium]
MSAFGRHGCTGGAGDPQPGCGLPTGAAEQPSVVRRFADLPGSRCPTRYSRCASGPVWRSGFTVHSDRFKVRTDRIWAVWTHWTQRTAFCEGCCATLDEGLIVTGCSLVATCEQQQPVHGQCKAPVFASSASAASTERGLHGIGAAW